MEARAFLIFCAVGLVPIHLVSHCVPSSRGMSQVHVMKMSGLLLLFGNKYVVAGDYKAMRVRTGMWGDGKWHLYNIKQDPGETRPLEAEQPERLQKMIAIFENYAKGKGIVPVADDWSPWSAL